MTDDMLMVFFPNNTHVLKYLIEHMSGEKKGIPHRWMHIIGVLVLMLSPLYVIALAAARRGTIKDGAAKDAG
jgi:hypothetical protein